VLKLYAPQKTQGCPEIDFPFTNNTQLVRQYSWVHEKSRGVMATSDFHTYSLKLADRTHAQWVENGGGWENRKVAEREEKQH